MHYQRWKHHGDPEALVRKPYVDATDYFLANYDKPAAHDQWPGALFEQTGYAALRYNGALTTAHVASCTLAHGPRPEGMEVLHSCTSRSCFWSAHLRWGTRAENQADRLRDGTDQNGERNAMARLTADQVLEIRARYAANSMSQQALADTYNVTRRHIRGIIARRNWRHV